MFHSFTSQDPTTSPGAAAVAGLLASDTPAAGAPYPAGKAQSLRAGFSAWKPVLQSRCILHRTSV